MGADNCGNAVEVVGEESANDELAFLLADPRFKVSERNRAFLRYIGEAAIHGRNARIKAYEIALDVFGRGADFDSLNDPIVRIEATRLRAALEHYYATFGADHHVHIRLPRGRYAPEFEIGPVDEPEDYIKLDATYSEHLVKPSPVQTNDRSHAPTISRNQIILTAAISALGGAGFLAGIQVFFR
jgi:hypothetical protein